MGCKLAENEPLKRLRLNLGFPLQCHSLREDCLHKLDKPLGNFTMGIPGAVLGYCQALFKKEGSNSTNTESIAKQLASIRAPWHKSHELYWGNKEKSESIEDFIDSSMLPLLGSGRIPILITPLDPKVDHETVNQIFRATPKVFQGETILVRIVLSSRESIDQAIKIIKSVLSQCRDTGAMPKLWPLLQGNLSKEEWEYLKDGLGSDWQYSNIAVNPFTMESLPEFCMDQVTVAQVVLGHKEGIHDSGAIQLPVGMRISGASEEDSYNIFDYFTKLSVLETVPTLIVLGPSLNEWSNEYNLERIEKLMPILKKACDLLWNGISTSRREMVWKLTA